MSRRDDRWRLLAPVRETLLQDFPPEARDKARLVKLFLARAALGSRIGTEGWGEVRDSVTADAGNFDAMIGVASNEAAPLDGLADGREARAGIGEWIVFYNERRLHQALGYRAPMAVWREGAAPPACGHVDNARALTTCPQEQKQTQPLAA